MTDKKISELTSITGANVSDANDVLPIVDTSVATTKKITRAELFKGVSSVDINGGTIDGTVIGGSTPAAISGTTGTFSGNLTVDTDTLFVDAANNRVGVGTASPTSRLHVAGGLQHITNGSGGPAGIEIAGNANSPSATSMFVGQGSDSTGFVYQRANSVLSFGTNNTERMRIDSSGNVLCGSDGGGDIGSSTKRFKDLYLSGGVYLGGTGAANYLDDYEEGTWTPTDGSGAGLTFTVSFAKYTKIGNLCHLQAYFTYPSTADINNNKINGLPFAAQAQGFAAFYVNSAIEVMAQVEQNASSLVFRNLSNIIYTNAQLSGGFIIFSGTYITA